VSQDLLLGVDVGGTKVAAGLVNANGEILSQQRVTMVPTLGRTRLAGLLFGNCETLCATALLQSPELGFALPAAWIRTPA